MYLQVHYTKLRPAGDQSGMRLKLTDDVLPFAAGMMMYASYFQVGACSGSIPLTGIMLRHPPVHTDLLSPPSCTRLFGQQKHRSPVAITPLVSVFPLFSRN